MTYAPILSKAWHGPISRYAWWISPVLGPVCIAIINSSMSGFFVFGDAVIAKGRSKRERREEMDRKFIVMDKSRCGESGIRILLGC